MITDDMTRFLDISKLGVTLGGTDILKDLGISFIEGEVTALLGHNGSGKSTLLKVLARQLPPCRGEVLLRGEPISKTQARAFARQVGYLPQHLPATDGLTVRELVALGRYPWRGALGRYRAEDHEIIGRSIADTELEEFMFRSVD